MKTGDWFREVGAGAVGRTRARLQEAKDRDVSLFWVWAEIDLSRPISVTGPADLCDYALGFMDVWLPRDLGDHELCVNVQHLGVFL